MPKLKIFPHAISREYCNYLISENSQYLTPAMFWTKGERIYDPKVREAFNCKFKDHHVEKMTKYIVTEFSGIDIAPSCIEPPEIVCYPPGNGSERHLDGPHRSHSIVYFLNEGFSGGELVFDSGEVFKDLGHGTAVIWENDADAWHACNPITEGFKWIIVSWVRKSDHLESESEFHSTLKEVSGNPKS